MNVTETTATENQKMIHSTIHAALHGATRNEAGQALLSLAYSFAAYVAPDNSLETQACLALQLAADALNDLDGEDEVISVQQYLTNLSHE